MRSEASYPVGNLSDHASRHWLSLHCVCGHWRTFDPADLIERLGNIPMRALCANAACEKCGARGAELIVSPPTRVDGSDRPRLLERLT